MRKDWTQNLWLLGTWLFLAYVGTGVMPKVFTYGLGGVDKVSQNQYAIFSTAGGIIVGLLIVFGLGWLRHFKRTIPWEGTMTCVSGFSTAVVIVTTTLMYTFKGVSVMVAQVLMRGSVIILMLGIDGIMIWRGLSTTKITRTQYKGVAFALAAIALAIFAPARPLKPGQYAATFTEILPTLLAYIFLGYAIRLFIQQLWKHKKGEAAQDNRGFFAVEQLFAVATLVAVAVYICFSSSTAPGLVDAQQAFKHWNGWAMVSGIFFGLVAVPSVFLMMLKGRTGTFGALLNRVVTLIAGTIATCALAIAVAGQNWPTVYDWVSFGLLLLALHYVGKAAAEKKKAAVTLVRPAGATA
ncbi:hypothetical protein HYW83_04785 [Candidatus Peregrinibacteria bacterium]|nr:hypothetical protein [Candidatus Peregrinibacteria bacterium]